MDMSELIDGEKQQSVFDSNEFLTPHNSLFVKKVQESIQLLVPDVYQEQFMLQPTIESVVESEEFKFYYSDFMHDEAEQDVLIERMRRAMPGSSIEIRINSNGGSVDEGIRIYNTVKDAFSGKIMTVIDSKALSMGALLFCAGDKRVTYEFGSLMFHTGRTGGAATPSNMVRHLSHESDTIARLEKRIMDRYFTKEELKSMDNGVDHWMNAEEMCYRGLATHVIVEGFELEASEYIDFIESDLDIADFLELIDDLDDATEE